MFRVLQFRFGHVRLVRPRHPSIVRGVRARYKIGYVGRGKRIRFDDARPRGYFIYFTRPRTCRFARRTRVVRELFTSCKTSCAADRTEDRSEPAEVFAFYARDPKTFVPGEFNEFSVLTINNLRCGSCLVCCTRLLRRAPHTTYMYTNVCA